MNRHLSADPMVKERDRVAVWQLFNPASPKPKRRRDEEQRNADALSRRAQRHEPTERAADNHGGVNLLSSPNRHTHHFVKVELLEGGNVQIASMDRVPLRKDLPKPLHLAPTRRGSEPMEVDQGS